MHPDEVAWDSPESVSNAIAEHFPQLPPNVRIVLPSTPINSHSLMDLSDLVMTYTSTVGMEAAALGRPVAVSGAAHYRGKGFTIDVEGPGDLPALMVADDPTFEPRPDLALRYMFMWFYRLNIPIHALVPVGEAEAPDALDALEALPSSATRLAPGADPYVDFVCDRMLHGGPFVLPSALVRPVEGQVVAPTAPRGEGAPSRPAAAG